MKKTLFIDTIRSFILEHDLIMPGSTVLVGLSGGPDSVCLLHVLNELKQALNITLIAAHLDHGWRPESEKEAAFCQSLCDAMGVRLVIQKLSNLSSEVKNNGSREEYARKIRRQFFEAVAQQHAAQAIALGHHRDDQLETFFIRLIRGASVSGLTGMRPKHGRYIRPLLCVDKQKILNHLAERGIAYVIDPSNDSDAYLRNRIRHQLLPTFKAVDVRAYENVEKTMKQLQEVESYLAHHMIEIWQKIATQKDVVWHVDIKQLLALHVSMRHRVLMHWFIMANVPFVPTQRFFAEIEKFLRSKQPTGEHCLHTTWKLCKKRETAYINKLKHHKNLTLERW